jgi:hypothetical protein
MKKLLIIIALVLGGCDKYASPKGSSIISKAYSLERRKKLMPCICMYEYQNNGRLLMFEDSCNKYNIGDTIK